MKNTDNTFKVGDKVFSLGLINVPYGYVKAVYEEGGKTKLAVYFPNIKQTGYGYLPYDFVSTFAEAKAHAKALKADFI